jgi:superfamily II DNA or RNA helicase
MSDQAIENPAPAKTLFHGTLQDNLDKLEARQPNKGAWGDKGIYGADNLNWAALYALAKDRKGIAVVGGSTPKLLTYKTNKLAPEGYVYEYASDQATPPAEHDPNIGWHIPHDVTPIKKHIVKLVDHMKNIEQFDDKETLRRRFAELTKKADLLPEVNLQPHQERIQATVDEENPRMIVYHGLGSGKSLSALAAAEAAKQKYNEDYGIVAPASLRGNFQKEVDKFTTGSKPEILSYTGLGMGKKFKAPPETLIMDEAHRLRNPGGAAAQAARDAADQAKRVLLLTGSPITNSPSDLANLISIVARKNISPQDFEKKFIGQKTVYPGLFNYLGGVKPGVQPVIRNEKELRQLLENRVDYQPSKTPEGVNVNEERIAVPMTDAQQRIQKALRTKIPPSFLWKLDKEFPLSKDELSKLNSFLTGLRQNSVSTRPFRSDSDAFRSFQQSGKLQEAYKRLREMLDVDPRKKAIIYSNHIGAGIEPYAAALDKFGIPYGVFHGGVPTKARQKALADYNAGKLRALLIGPAGAEGLSTKGTNLIQLLDPHWHESRTQQARGRGLRFDSHDDLPEELKNVHVQRFISQSEDPSWLGKLMGHRRERTGDEILERLSNEKEKLNERFRELLREVGTKAAADLFSKKTGSARNEGLGILASMDASMLPDPDDLDVEDYDRALSGKRASLRKLIKEAAVKSAGFRWYKRFPVNEHVALNMSLGGPSLTLKKILPNTSLTLGNRAPRLYVGTPIPGLAYQKYISPKKHKIKAEKEFKDEDPEIIDTRTTYEKVRDFLFGSQLDEDE